MSSQPGKMALRIGPVYSTADLVRWGAREGGRPLTPAIVRDRARYRQLVAFRTDDGRWAFPAYALDAVAGRLVPNADVLELWVMLPFHGVLTDADLAAFLGTRHFGLTGDTPAPGAKIRCAVGLAPGGGGQTSTPCRGAPSGAPGWQYRATRRGRRASWRRRWPG